MKRWILLALSLSIAGCGGDGPTKPPPGTVQPFQYPDASTPQNALLRMAAGFEMRDSVVTASVYDDAYQGSSTDNTDPGSATLTFSKADEVAVVTHMQESRSITLVDVDLSSPSTWVRSSYASDSLGWATLYLSGWSILVQDVAAGEFYASSSEPGTHLMEFKLKPTTPDPSSATDTTWKIVGWVELRAYR